MDPKDALAQIDAEISRGKGEARACEKFKKKFKKIISGGLNIDSPSHLNKKQALDYLEALEKYPSHPTAWRRAHELFEENAESLLGSQAPEVTQRTSSFHPECMMYSVQVHMNLLFRDVAAFEFTKKERAKVERVAKAYFASQRPFLSTANARIKASAFETYLDKVFEGPDREALLQKARELNNSIKARQEESQAKLKQGPGPESFVEGGKVELQAAKEASGAFSELLKSAKL